MSDDLSPHPQPPFDDDCYESDGPNDFAGSELLCSFGQRAAGSVLGNRIDLTPGAFVMQSKTETLN